MAQLNVREAEGPVYRLTSSSTITRGDLLYITGGAWELADADSHTTPAQFVALNGNGGSSTARVMAVRACKFYDEDAVFTADSLIYLSSTAGGWTHTRPTAAARIRQVVGVGVTTKEAEIRISSPREFHVPWEVKGATSAFAQLDSGDFGGATIDAQNEVALLQQTVPENATGVVISKIRVAAEASAGTPTADITVSGNVADDSQWDGVAADATLANQATEGSAPDAITEINVTTGLDATNVVRPGSILGMRVLKDDGGTDIIHILGGHSVYRVV